MGTVAVLILVPGTPAAESTGGGTPSTVSASSGPACGDSSASRGMDSTPASPFLRVHFSGNELQEGRLGDREELEEGGQRNAAGARQGQGRAEWNEVSSGQGLVQGPAGAATWGLGEGGLKAAKAGNEIRAVVQRTAKQGLGLTVLH